MWTRTTKYCRTFFGNALRTAREADADVVVYGYYKQFLDKDGSACGAAGRICLR